MRPFPTGWFRVAAAADLGLSTVRTVEAFDQELVLFRGGSGQLTAASPFCPHLGAHLGRGGRVEGDSLRCPFHGLRFAADGRCLDGSKGRLRTWPSHEWQGQIFVWFGEAPSYSLPRLEDGWSTPAWTTLRMVGHVQDVAENGVDLPHFAEVHRYERVREATLAVQGAQLLTKFAFTRRNPLGRFLPTVDTVFDTEMWGLGCSITRLSVTRFDLRFRLLLLAMQVNVRELDFTIGVSAPHPVPTLVSRLLLPTIVRDVLQDKEIWAHKSHLERPALTAADAALVTFRKYSQQFYD